MSYSGQRVYARARNDHPMTVTIDDIRKAAELITDGVIRTPAISSAGLSAISGADVVLKLENLQVTGSFKPRGAMVKMSSLSAEERKAGVIASSAGNHAQGVAYHAQRWDIPAVIVMPEHTPFTKVARTEAYGAKIVLHGENLADSREHASIIAEKEGFHFIHPYDDEKVVAGQGTVGLELLEDHPDLDVLIIPIGGGGLIAGSAIAAKAANPDIEILGVEAALYPSMHQAMTGGGPCGAGQTIADGIAVKVPGEVTRPIIKELVSEILLVEETSIENAVETYLEAQHIVAEGAGAASLAVLLEHPDRFRGKKVGLVVSGGNIDSRLLSSIMLRGLVRAGRLVRLRVEIIDQPGVLAKVTGLIGDSGGNIVEVYHQRMFYDLPVKRADVDVVIETLDSGHMHKIMDRLEKAGFHTRVLGTTSGNAPS